MHNNKHKTVAFFNVCEKKQFLYAYDTKIKNTENCNNVMLL